MRTVLWLLLLFAVAVLAASTLGANDGLASFYWKQWRVDLSMNLFVVLLLAACVALVALIRSVMLLAELPQRAQQWRAERRERGAQRSLREALALYFGGRYTRARSAAQRALSIQGKAQGLADDKQLTILAHLLAAGSAHRLQDRTGRDAALNDVFELVGHAGDGASAAEPAIEGARMLAAEWAIDDRDADRALRWLAELPSGVARRTHALRLKLQAARLARQPLEALKTARMLANHQAFSRPAAEGMLRSLAYESLDAARDADQLRRTWLQFDSADRRDPFVAARAAQCAAELGAGDDARGWLRPFWERLADLAPDERAAIAQALARASAGIGTEWLPRLEAASAAYPRDGAIALAVGSALAQRQLWGKARQLLEQAANDPALGTRARREAWLQLALIARSEDDAERAAACFEAAARLGE